MKSCSTTKAVFLACNTNLQDTDIRYKSFYSKHKDLQNPETVCSERNNNLIFYLANFAFVCLSKIWELYINFVVSLTFTGTSPSKTSYVMNLLFIKKTVVIVKYMYMYLLVMLNLNTQSSNLPFTTLKSLRIDAMYLINWHGIKMFNTKVLNY